MNTHLKKFTTPEFWVYFLTCLLVLYRGVLYSPDSYAFLSMEINRSVGYVIFLSFFSTLFDTYYEFPLLIVQLGINIFGVYTMHKCLIKQFKFQKIFSILSLLILIAPLLYLYFTANKVLTEALAYPLFLIFIANSLYAIIECRKKNLIYSAIILILLVLVRGQFLSLIPIQLIACFYLAYYRRQKVYLLVGIFFMGLPFLTSLIDKGYHYVQYEHFISTPTAHHFTTPLFYVAEKEDVNLFSNTDEREYFKRVKKRLDEKKWTYEYGEKYDSIGIFDLYKRNFSKICNWTVQEYGMRLYSERDFSITEQYLATNELNESMFLPLLSNNYKKWIKLYIQNIKASLGNSKYLALHVILLMVGVFLIVKKNYKVGIFIVFSISCTFSNIILLAICTHSEKRYVFYTDWVLFIILFFFLDQYFKRSTSKHSISNLF